MVSESRTRHFSHRIGKEDNRWAVTFTFVAVNKKTERVSVYSGLRYCYRTIFAREKFAAGRWKKDI